jgi:VanZ family protein
VPVINKAARLAVLWLPVLGCMAVIFWASCVPGSNIPAVFPLQDIAFHLFGYGLMAFFFSRGLKHTRVDISPVKLIIFTVVFGLLYGISDEFHQSFVPNRTAGAFDVFIDTIGSLTGSLIFYGANKTL